MSSNSTLFHVIEDAAAILRTKRGIWRQTKVYRRGDDLFAALGGGFIRLYASNGTSHPDTSLDQLVGVEAKPDRLGRLQLAGGAK